MEKPVMALDVDGVILDFCGFWVQTAEDALGRELPALNRSYHFGTRLGLTRQEYDTCWNQFRAIDGWGKVPAYPGVTEALESLARNHRLVAVTGIPLEALEARKRNLAELRLPLEEVFATGHRDFSKEYLLQALQAEAFVDDRLRHLQEAENTGVPALFWVDRGDEQDLEPEAVVARRITHLEQIEAYL